MSEITQVLVHLLQLYIAIAVSIVGFAMMLGGKDKAGQAARFVFLRPVEKLASWARELITWLLAHAWLLLVLFILAPLGRALTRAMRWLISRARGRVRR